MKDAVSTVSRIAGMFGRKRHEDRYVWQDREIRFDQNQQELECRLGEFLIDRVVGMLLELIPESKMP